MYKSYEIYSASSIPHMRKIDMGRKKMWAEDMQARFQEGTFDRIDAVLEDGEERTQFVREAVERELRRRERKS
jgi:hypothetical protein